MSNNSWLHQLKNIIILPVTVCILIPVYISTQYRDRINIPENLLLQIAAILIFIAALFLFGRTIYLFKNVGKGTLAPWDPTSKLVIRGPYKHCRNPMITAVLFILLSEVMFFGSGNILIWAFSFFVINTIYFKVKEEPDLIKRFGKEYLDYRTEVPMWIPSIKAYSGNKTQS